MQQLTNRLFIKANSVSDWQEKNLVGCQGGRLEGWHLLLGQKIQVNVSAERIIAAPAAAGAAKNAASLGLRALY